jgi:hypothetical protein
VTPIHFERSKENKLSTDVKLDEFVLHQKCPLFGGSTAKYKTKSSFVLICIKCVLDFIVQLAVALIGPFSGASFLDGCMFVHA